MWGKPTLRTWTNGELKMISTIYLVVATSPAGRKEPTTPENDPSLSNRKAWYFICYSASRR
ncbi:hypothetical protein D4Z76_09380, partial [Campylobacter coli]